MPSEVVSLSVRGIVWRGWEDAGITRAVDAVAGGFEISLTDRWTESMAPVPIAATMPVVIASRAQGSSGAPDPLISGYVDRVSTELDSGRRTITISGRDASGDLVDCAAVHSPGEWRSKTCAQLAAILAAPFGVPVRCTAHVGAALPLHKIEPGETAWECLDRALRQRQLLAMPDGRGGVAIAEIGAERAVTALTEGKNVKAASVCYDATGRFSEYRVLAQNRGSDAAGGAAAAQVLGIARDAGVDRYRPMVVTGESPKDAAGAARRAEWEASVRAGRSATVEVTVQGWRQGDGSLWPINALCRVELPSLRLSQELLIGKTVFKISNDGGTTAQLTLRSPLAYAQNYAAKVRKGRKGKTGRGGGDLLAGAVELSETEQKKILAGGG